MKRMILLLAAAAAGMAAQDRPLLPTLAERNWFRAEPIFTSPAAPAAPAERAWKTGPAFTVDNFTAPVVSGRTWEPARGWRFAVETATYVPPAYRMVSGLPARDTAVAARVEFRF
jgi:hypothetical protein